MIDTRVSQEDIVKPDNYDYEGAHAVNKKLGKTAEGRKLLSSELGTEDLDTYVEVEKLKSENVRDAMTGVFNYGYLMKELEARTKNPSVECFAVFWLDMDSLKYINDKHGHPAGSEVIIGMARLLENKIRPNEKGFVARYGGDEFIIVIPGVDTDQAAKIRAEEIRKTVSETRFRAGDNNIIETVSIGAGVWNGKETSDEFLNRVDASMYYAKEHGKNQVAFAKNNV